MEKVNKIIKNSYIHSLENCRNGDQIEEIEAIQNVIKNSKKIVVATSNGKKFKVVKNIILKVLDNHCNDNNQNNVNIEMLDICTNSADLTRMPALTKGLIAVDITDADLIIARGRLGIAGSGSLLLLMDGKGRILTGAMSPSSIIHKESIEHKMEFELLQALKKIGIMVEL
ncbi:DUF3236 domain-containing protein [Methanococcus voltae]|uniref:Uncharacterized protein n=1 Tax=Methanococcus voltae (strain ATCC BAA-1334 / A3) TaxID=456320 RepID=D7DUD3_METV3|nr:DUF3236 domain-containing protein [Methanococcus voltae]MCS3900543.1 hypothetical protein [Methanococcus voltae]